MEKYFGVVTTVKTNIETGEVIESTENNTQLNGIWQNLIATSAPNFTNNNSSSMIYISDSTNVLNRFTNTIINTGTTFHIAGTVISGEFWPQYSMDTPNNRAVFTFKQRFNPPASGSRTINTIALYAPAQGTFFAGLKLQTPCTQSSLEILDVFYKIYVYFDPTATIGNTNVNTTRSIYNNLIPRWFYTNGANLYAEGTSTIINSASGSFLDTVGMINTDINLNDLTSSDLNNPTGIYATNPWMYYTRSASNTYNQSQGTNLKSMAFTTTDNVGILINKLAVSRWDYGFSSGTGSFWASSPVLKPGDSRVQSVYLKSASSTSTNFAYLDPSTIGSSTATPVLNDSTWSTPQIPSMFKLSVVAGGGISTATYKISMRRSFGFASNFFNTERSLPLNNIYRRFGVTTFPYTANSFNSKGANTKRLNDQEIVTSSPGGFSISNVYNQTFTNYDSTTTPAILTSAIVDAVPMPDGSILIVSTDKGLSKMSSDRTTITQFTGIGSGVNDNICYAAAVKHNGDIWAMFQGAIAKYSATSSTWTIYNSSTPITFIHSEYNPTWSNTLALFCRKDAGGDEILLTRQNSAILTWWSPSAPTPVNTTNNVNNTISKFSSTVRADYSRACASIPGTSVWFFPTANNGLTRITFGSTTGTNLIASGLSTTYPVLLSPLVYNGNWIMRAIEMPSSAATTFGTKYYDSTSTVLNDTANNNTMTSIGGTTFAAEMMDDYSTIIVIYAQNSTYIYNAWLQNPVSPLGTMGWRNYGWNSGTSQWEVDNTNARPVHSTSGDLPDGMKCYFTPTGTNDFITGERWIGYLFDGLHKDNSTTATLNHVTHARNSYMTTDLSASTVPASGLGTVTENVSMYTLDGNRYSWNGGVSQQGSASNTTALSMRSELWFTGDVTLNFYTQRYSEVANVTTSACYFSLYERDAGSPTSKWAFQFRNDGYVVAEDDTARTTRTLPATDADKYTIKRVGSTITYLVNDVLVYTSLVTSSLPLRVMVRMPTGDTARTFYNVKATYNETRRVIRIGDALDQTGTYDPDYTMVEAWLTNPRTTTITIDGVPATITTDPLVSPAAGQVLLLQKSGWLVFNSADAGKVVTCNSMVMLET